MRLTLILVLLGPMLAAETTLANTNCGLVFSDQNETMIHVKTLAEFIKVPARLIVDLDSNTRISPFLTHFAALLEETRSKPRLAHATQFAAIRNKIGPLLSTHRDNPRKIIGIIAAAIAAIEQTQDFDGPKTMATELNSRD